MKQFVIKLFLFIVLLSSLYYIVFTFSVKLLGEKIESHSIILIGDSQTEFIKGKNLYNRSIHGSPFFSHLNFIETFSDELEDKTILLSFNYHNFSNLYQNRLLNDSLFPGWRINMMDYLDEYNLLNFNHKDLRPTNVKWSILNIKKIRSIFKEYLSLNNNVNSNKYVNDTSIILNDINRHWYHKGYVHNDQIQKKYLRKIIKKLKKLNCNVFFVKMPLTNFYKSKIPRDIKRNYHSFIKESKIKLLDIDSIIDISNNYELFKDYGHLNLSGDKKVKAYFSSFKLQ